MNLAVEGEASTITPFAQQRPVRLRPLIAAASAINVFCSGVTRVAMRSDLTTEDSILDMYAYSAHMSSDRGFVRGAV